MMSSVIVVIGAGLSGVMAARELLRADFDVVLIDPAARPGRGLAYGTAAPWHLLNSPASTMSVDPDDPDQFRRWCAARHIDDTFVPRATYGEYLSETLRTAPGDLTVQRGRVVRVFENARGYSVLLADNVVINADRVVLALGNVPSRYPGADVQDPWAPGALDALPPGDVLLIGTGLTAVDVALTLSRQGRRVHAYSRHGLVPQRHATHEAMTLDPPAGRTLTALMRGIRVLASIYPWRAVMDALRPHWNELWARLGEADRERFLRHVARYWEVHRHRMAPSVRPPFTVVATPEGNYAAVVNCTGPGRLVESSPLVRSLIAEGLARPGPFGLGLDVSTDGALLDRAGSPGGLYTLGPSRRGVLWETTAAPEIRAQARALAAHLGTARSTAASGSALGSGRADSAYPLPG